MKSAIDESSYSELKVALLVVYDSTIQSHASRSSRLPKNGGTAGKQ